MIKSITFDLDMTLIDFMKMKTLASNAAAKAMIKAGLKMPLKQCQEELFSYYITDIEGEKVFQNFLKAKNGYSQRILAAGINAYLKIKQKNLKPYPNVKKTLKILKKRKIKLGIITDAPKLKAYMRLDAIGICDYFDVVVGKEDTGKLKPSKHPFKKALSLLGTKANENMHVGDWPQRDIIGAKSIGMVTCLALYGYDKKFEYVKADYEIKSFDEILKIVF
jgi:putative hydrolase of the HAD superfamily